MANAKNSYELTFVVSGVLSDDQTQKAIRRITDLIEKGDGEVLEADEWGSRRLAYNIQGKRTGYYTTVYFQAPGALIPRLERQMTIDDDILRYLTLRMDAKMQRHYRAQKQERTTAEAAEAEEEA